MPNPVHLIAIPESDEGLRRAIGEAHRRYSRRVNFREGWRGHLWQGRFGSYAMDDSHLLVAAHLSSLNPVRAHLAERPEAYRFSSAAAHLAGRDDRLVHVEPLLALAGDWRDFLRQEPSDTEAGLLKKHETTGRPLGAPRFVTRLEQALGKRLRPRKPCPPRGDK